jgi:phytoene dehydrogenase-like protein
MKAQFTTFFSEADWRANTRLQEEIAQLREEIAPTWLEEPLSIEDTAERYVRPALREVFVGLCRGSVGRYLDRFEFRSDLLKAMYAVTDGVSGLTGTVDTPGSGMNFLAHNMCRLPGSDGTWMIVRGGMGTVTTRLAGLAREAGARILTSEKVSAHRRGRGRSGGGAHRHGAGGAHRGGGGERRPVPDAGPGGDGALPGLVERAGGRVPAHRHDLQGEHGAEGLPRFRCLPEDRGQFGSTMHLLPDEGEVMASLTQGSPTCRPGDSRSSRPSSGTCTRRWTRRCATRKGTTTRRSSCSGYRTP